MGNPYESPSRRRDERTTMENHCLVLLTYASRHKHDPQSYSILSERCRMPEGTLKAIVSFHRHHEDRSEIDPFTKEVVSPASCYLCQTASKYHFSFRVSPKDNGRFIEAEKVNYDDDSERVQRGRAVLTGFLTGDLPARCPECGSRIIQGRDWEFVCEGCGLVF